MNSCENRNNAFEAKNVQDVKELTESEIDEVFGGAAVCKYESKEYSEGSVIKMADGATHTCTASGTWT